MVPKGSSQIVPGFSSFDLLLGYPFELCNRFNRLAWGFVDNARPRGVIAAGMENGELSLWDPAKILASAEYVVMLLHSTLAY